MICFGYERVSWMLQQYFLCTLLQSKAYYVMVMDICFSLSDCTEIFFGHILCLTNSKNDKRKFCSLAFFVLYNPCVHDSSMRFLLCNLFN